MMRMRKKFEKLLMLLQTTIINIGLMLGLYTFYYSRKHKSFINSKWLCFYCKFMAFIFLLAYPIGLSFYIYDRHFILAGITGYARLSLSIANWMLCFITYLTIASNSSSTCEIYNRVIALYSRHVSMYDTDKDFVNDLKIWFMMKCVMRSFLLLFGFLAINHFKFWRHEIQDDSLLGFLLFFSLLLPSVIITFSSNRFYTAATCCLYFIELGNENLKRTELTCREFNELQAITLIREQFFSFIEDKILISLRNHAALYQLFKSYHDLNAKYIIFIIGYCILNVIFELFFLYVHLSLSTQNGVNLSLEFIFFSFAQTFLFMHEFISIIFIYNELKMESKEFASTLQRINTIKSTVKCSKISCQIEMYSIQLMHCKFDVTVCGLFTINKSLLFSIASSITTYLILIIQFRIEELSTNATDPEGSRFITMFGQIGNKTLDEP